MEATEYKIENEVEMPYGMLHNNFNFPMTIDGKEYANVSEYLYVNLFRFLLYRYSDRLKSLKMKGLMWVDLCIKKPESCDFVKHFLKESGEIKSMYEKFKEAVEKFRRNIISHHYTKVLTQKLLSDDKLLSKFISLKEREFVYRDNNDMVLGLNKNNEGSNIIGLILKDIHNLFESQNLFVLIFKPYIVYCILKHYLTVELNDFQLLKSYVDLGQLISTSKGEVDLMKKIIDEFQVSHSIKRLKTFEFENDIKNKEFCSILISSIKDPIILMEYTINKYFNSLLYRMNNFRKKIIFNVYIQQKFGSNSQGIERELKSVNVSKLTDAIFTLYISRSLPIEIQSMIDAELGRYVFISSFSRIFSDEILKAKELEESKEEIKLVYEFDSGVKFITESISKLKDLFRFFDVDLDRIKELLLRISLCKKFGHSSPDIEEEFFKSHKIILSDEDKSNRQSKDLQHLLKTSEKLIIKYNDKDEFVSNFMGKYLNTLSVKTKVEKYKWDEKLNEFVERDLFMSNWLMRTSHYVMNYVKILIEYINDKENMFEKIQDMLVCLGCSEEFLTIKQEAPYFFQSMVDKEMNKIIKEEDNLNVINLIWNFVMYNVVVLYKNRKNFFGTNYQSKIKELLVFFYVKLQRESKCIIEYAEENKEYNLLSCVVNASFNVKKILTGLELNVGDRDKVRLISSIILNRTIESNGNMKKIKIDERGDVIGQIIDSNNLEGISVEEMKKIWTVVENEKMSNILKMSRINLFLDLKV